MSLLTTTTTTCHSQEMITCLTPPPPDPISGYPVVWCRLLQFTVLTSHHLPSGLSPSHPSLPVPGCSLSGHGAGRRAAPGPVDADSGALPAHRGAGQASLPADRAQPQPQSRPQPEPAQTEDAFNQQPMGPDGQWGRRRLGAGRRREWRGAAVLGVPGVAVQAADLLHSQDRRGEGQ